MPSPKKPLTTFEILVAWPDGFKTLSVMAYSQQAAIHTCYVLFHNSDIPILDILIKEK